MTGLEPASKFVLTTHMSYIAAAEFVPVRVLFDESGEIGMLASNQGNTVQQVALTS